MSTAPPDPVCPVLDPDLPFRVEAGPGAGKTRWLVEQIRHTLTEGARLRENGRARIACITYTNAGTETVQQRLGLDAERLWISTIHSFLYHHLVRPYAHRLGIEGFKTHLIEGHDVVRPRTADGHAWLESLGMSTGLWHMEPALRKNLAEHLVWRRDSRGEWEVRFTSSKIWREVSKVRKPSIVFDKPGPLLSHKTRLWERGRIDHDDLRRVDNG